MTWFSFVAEMTKALVWPLVVVIFILLYRVPLARLVNSFAGRPLRAKVAGNEIEVGVEEVKAMGEDLPPPEQKQLIRTIRKAPTAPGKTIAESWKQLQVAAASVLDQKSNESLLDVAVALKGSGILDQKKFRLYSQLRDLGEKAARTPEHELSADSAIDYAEIANRLTRYIADKTTSEKEIHK